MENDKLKQFERIWKRGTGQKDRLRSKVIVRGLPPTKKNCCAYWMGWVKPVRKSKGKVDTVEWAHISA